MLISKSILGVPNVKSVQLPNNRPIKTPPLFFPKTLKAHHVVTFPDRSRKNNVNVIPSRWKPQEENVSHISDTFRQAPQAGAQQQRQGGRRHPPSSSPSSLPLPLPHSFPPPSERVHETCLTRIGPGCCGVWRHQGERAFEAVLEAVAPQLCSQALGGSCAQSFWSNQKLAPKAEFFEAKLALRPRISSFPTG